MSGNTGPSAVGVADAAGLGVNVGVNVATVVDVAVVDVAVVDVAVVDVAVVVGTGVLMGADVLCATAMSGRYTGDGAMV